MALAAHPSSPNASTILSNSPSAIAAKQTERNDIQPVDTLIAPQSCDIHAAYRNREDAHVPYKPALDGHAASLHDLVCRWAVDRDLSVDSTRLPQYVEAMSDTLRLSTDAMAYAVQFRPSGKGDVTYQKDLFLVANVADSLYYRRLKTVYNSLDQRTSLSVRGLRTLEVPGATQAYIWVEVEDRSVARETVSQENSTPVSEFRQWFGYVFAYDRIRGLRYLLDGVVPIRIEDIRAGETIGVMQWDVSIPEPGIMEVVPRKHWGKDRPPGPRGWLGAHVIDSSAVADTSVYRHLLEPPGSD